MNILDMNRYYAAIITHRMKKVSELHRYYFHNLSDTLKKAKQLGYPIVILQTCNRIEVYSYGYEPKKIIYELNIGTNFCQKAKTLIGYDVLKHLIYVISGLDSLAIGEHQIVGQVRRAFKESKENGCMSPELEYLFNQALKIGRIVRSRIMLKTLDYVEATINIIKRYGGIKNILIIGTGELAKDILSAIKERDGVYNISLAGRDTEKLNFFKKVYGIQIVNISDGIKDVSNYDAIIACTSSTTPILKIKATDSKKVFIDLGIPRNIEFQNKKLTNVYDIDYISEYIKKHNVDIDRKVRIIESFIEIELEKFRKKQELKTVEYFISEIYKKAENIRNEEYNEALKELNKIIKDQILKRKVGNIIRNLSWSLTKKLYHYPIHSFRRLCEDNEIDTSTLTKLIKLFLDRNRDGQK